MVTIAQALEDTIKNSSFLEEGLSSGIFNLSAVARFIKPEVEKRTYKKVTEASLIMALRRFKPKPKKTRKNISEIKQLRGLILRSHLVEYALHNSPYILPLQKYLLRKVEKEKELFVNLSQGVAETAIIGSESLQKDIESIIPKEIIIDKIEHLSAITLRLRREHVYIPGVHYLITRALAWQEINVIETISSYSEITIFVEEKDSERAFACIRALTL